MLSNLNFNCIYLNKFLLAIGYEIKIGIKDALEKSGMHYVLKALTMSLVEYFSFTYLK